MNNKNWEKIDIDSYKFSLEQGEKMLKETIDTASFQISRSSTILKFSLGFLVAVLGYLISNSPELSLKYCESVIALICLFITSAMSFNCYSSKSFQVKPLGNNPFNILSDESIQYIQNHYQLSDLHKLLIFNACRTVEESINNNVDSNNLRAKKISKIESAIKWSLTILIAFPLSWYLVSQFLPE